jgi:shikimate dehydrogenase
MSPRAFVIGWPISHSRSPLIHHYWLEQLGIAGSYARVPVAPPDLATFLANIEVFGFAGGNVTLPHKEKAFAVCAVTTPVAERLKAVNTLWIDRGQLAGDNTDVEGFLASLDADIPRWDKSGDKAVVLGAGGAARGIVYALNSRGVRHITLVNRTRSRGEDLQRQFPDVQIELADFAALPGPLKDADLLVNTTSLGMVGQPPLDIDLAPLPDHAVVADIVYAPLETALLRRAAARGLRISGGLGMLLYQAAPGFARWFGQTPQVTPGLRALVAADIAGKS